jgi:uncharacterized protein (DUF4415 family)
MTKPLKADLVRGDDRAGTSGSADAWSNHPSNRLFRRRKEPISIRVDTDVLDWLRQRADHYQTEINNILRETMIAETQGPRGS